MHFQTTTRVTRPQPLRILKHQVSKKNHSRLTWLNPGKLSPMLTLFFMRMLGCEKLIFKLCRLSCCSGEVRQLAVLHIRPGTRLRAPGRMRCSGTRPPPAEGDVGDSEGLDVELTEAPGEVAEFRSPAAPRPEPEPGLAARSHALYCCPGPLRCSEPRSLRPEPSRDDPGRLPSLFCDHMPTFFFVEGVATACLRSRTLADSRRGQWQPTRDIGSRARIPGRGIGNEASFRSRS